MDNKTQIIKDIISEIANIKEAIRNRNLDEFAKEKLLEQQENLQKKLNELLEKKGIITNTEADKLYEELRLQKRGELEAQSKRGFTAFYLGAAILIVGLYFAYKKKKS